MSLMADFDYDQQITMRSIGSVKGAFDRVVGDLRSAGRLRFRGRKISREAFANAVWLYLADLSEADQEGLEGLLAPYVSRLESLMSEAEPDEAPQPRPGEGKPIRVIEKGMPPRQAGEGTEKKGQRQKKSG